MVVIHVSLYSSYWCGVYLYHYVLGALGILEHTTIFQGVGSTAARTNGYVGTLALLSLFLTNRKAKDYTRRKVVGWWEDHVLVTWHIWSAANTVQPEANQPGANQPGANRPEASLQGASQSKVNQPKANQSETGKVHWAPGS